MKNLAVIFFCLLGFLESDATPQPNVLSNGKKSAVFIEIHLKNGSEIGPILKKFTKFENLVDELCSAQSCQRKNSDIFFQSPQQSDQFDDEILAGIGFGIEFYLQATGKNTGQNFTYQSRKGIFGEMPYTGGDILIHAKSNSQSKLFELSQLIKKNLPPESLREFRDIYGFTYKDGRDLSGFIDGTENPGEWKRYTTAIEPETNGSYCLTQQWIHDLDFIASQSDATLENFVGRKMTDSSELKNKSISSHVARMTSGPQFQSPKPVEIYRQSMPFGSLSSGAGLFFIAFASSPNNFDFMLNRMTGKTEETSDDIMRLSRCVSGNFWFFPSTMELEKLQNTITVAGSSASGGTLRITRPRTPILKSDKNFARDLNYSNDLKIFAISILAILLQFIYF